MMRRRRKTCLSQIVRGPFHPACGTLSLGLEVHRQGGECFLPPAPCLTTAQLLRAVLLSEPMGANDFEHPRSMGGVQDQGSQRPLGRGRGVKNSPRQTFLCLQTLEKRLLKPFPPCPLTLPTWRTPDSEWVLVQRSLSHTERQPVVRS